MIREHKLASAMGCILTWLALLCVNPVIAENVDFAYKAVQPNQGYLFINGEYLAPPYDVAWSQDVLTVNGRDYSEDSFDLSFYQTESDRHGPGIQGPGMRGGGGMRFGARGGRDAMERGVRPTSFRRGKPQRRPRYDRSPFNEFCEDVSSVNSGGIVILFERLAPLCLYSSSGGHELLQSLINPSQRVDPDPKWVDRMSGRESWNQLIGEFSSTTDFERRARSDVNKVMTAEIEADEIVASAHWTAKISYPLTVFAMAVVVLGFGHLLSNKPKIESEQSDTLDLVKCRKVVGQSLLIIGLLSAVDLIWTIGSAHAGLMRELNPLGSGMINEPIQLFLFKATLTAASIGILYSLHRRPIAQMASWWCCLLLTLLTARWVVFQSMFL